jgi:hypothetical protein
LNSPNIVTITVSPIEYEHVLLIPRFGTAYHREVIMRVFCLLLQWLRKQQILKEVLYSSLKHQWHWKE